MEKLSEILHELGISKVKLAKFLGVSRQMIYNYLELDDINKWPKDKKVLLLNLLGVKSSEEIDNIKIDTDYIMDVENRLNNICQENIVYVDELGIQDKTNCEKLGSKQQELLTSINEILNEKLSDEKDIESFYTMKYLYHFLQSIDNNPELKYILAYVAKAAGLIKAEEYNFDEKEQFVLESIMFSLMTLYERSKSDNPKDRISPAKIEELHRRFVAKIDQKREEKMSRTLELNTLKMQALKELGYNGITGQNYAEVLEKIAEIESRKIV